MKVWVYEANKLRGDFIAVSLEDDASRVYKIAQAHGCIDSDRLGCFWDEVIRGLPGYPARKDYYETENGGITSAMGKVWEIDRTYKRIAIVFADNAKKGY